MAKIDSNVTAAINESSTSTPMAYVTMQDVSEDEAMTLFKQKYPAEYDVYMYAKYGQNGDMTAEEIAAIDDEQIQAAIERKREVYKQLYSESNSGIIEQYYDDSEVLFISSYAPVAIVETDATSLTWSARNSSVLSISVTSTDDALPNLDLRVYGPDGSLLGTSVLEYANFEIVQFVPPSTGTYTIKITGPSDQAANIGIAVW